MTIPTDPKIYHIVHVDRLPSIVKDGCLWCDEEILQRPSAGTLIGMNGIKERRLKELTLTSHPELHIGACVPFYFCPRSIMLYLIYQANHPELAYRGGQGPVIHMEADLRATVAWADKQNQRWAFTITNAGSYYFEDRCDLARLSDINWDAVQASQWSGHYKEAKQAEFLIEHQFPWELISCIGVQSLGVYNKVLRALQLATHKPSIKIKPDWYYY